MGVPQRLVSLLDKTFSCFFSRLKTRTSKWRRVQDPRKPRRVAQTFLPCSHKGKSKNSKKLLVLWTVTQMVSLFAEKMAGGTDDDDTILKSFDAFEIGGKIDAEMFKHSLMTWGDKFTDTEVDDAFAEFTIEDGQIDAAHLKSLMVAKKEGEEEA